MLPKLSLSKTLPENTFSSIVKIVKDVIIDRTESSKQFNIEHKEPQIQSNNILSVRIKKSSVPKIYIGLTINCDQHLVTKHVQHMFFSFHCNIFLTYL